MKNIWKKISESEFTWPVIYVITWSIVFIVDLSRAWTDDVLTCKTFARLLIDAMILLYTFLGLGECSKRRERRKATDRLDILAKMIFRDNTDSIEIERYKKLLSYEELEKWNKMDIWEPCIFKPCMEQPGSHQDLDGYYNKELNLFKIDPHFNQDKFFDGVIWKEKDVLEFTMKGTY